MKTLKTFIREAIPLVLSLVAWMYNLRPVTYLLDTFSVAGAKNIQDTVKVAWDVLLLSALVKTGWELLERPYFLSIKGQISNKEYANRTTLTAAEHPKEERLFLVLEVGKINRPYLTVLSWLGGAVLVVRSPGQGVTLTLDARFSADEKFISVFDDRYPSIRLTDQIDRLADSLQLVYSLYAVANSASLQAGQIMVDIQPQVRSGFLKPLAWVAIRLFTKTDVAKHWLHTRTP